MANYRVAVLGVAHMHVNELMRKFAELPNVEMVAIADTVPEVPEKNVTSRSTRMGSSLREKRRTDRTARRRSPWNPAWRASSQSATCGRDR